MRTIGLLLLAAALARAEAARDDGATRLDVREKGSLQNPVWSPDGGSILFTRFRNGYNAGPADLLVYDLATRKTRVVVADGSDNVCLPGSSWNSARRAIVFSSSREPHDEVYVIAEAGRLGSERRLTDREGEVAYEPTWSPDGAWIVFESHPLDVEGRGVICKVPFERPHEVMTLTGEGEDARQPNWAPAGDRVVYQRHDGKRWELWTMKPDGTEKNQITSGDGDKTDASFSPDGAQVVFSMDPEDDADLYVIPTKGGEPVRLTRSPSYDGAPSWSPDGKRIAFESCPESDPDESTGTRLWVIDASR